MNDGNELPTMYEFVKSLAIVLLTEAAICLAMSAACRVHAEGQTGASGLLIAFYAVVGLAILSNVATIAVAARFTREEPSMRPYAETSFFVTTAQTILLATLCFFAAPATAAVAAIVAFVALVSTLALTPGKFPPDSMLR